MIVLESFWRKYWRVLEPRTTGVFFTIYFSIMCTYVGWLGVSLSHTGLEESECTTRSSLRCPSEHPVLVGEHTSCPVRASALALLLFVVKLFDDEYLEGPSKGQHSNINYGKSTQEGEVDHVTCRGHTQISLRVNHRSYATMSGHSVINRSHSVRNGLAGSMSHTGVALFTRRAFGLWGKISKMETSATSDRT